MRNEYKIVEIGGEGEIVEKKSRFIATVRPVKSEEEALSFLGSHQILWGNPAGNRRPGKSIFQSSAGGIEK